MGDKRVTINKDIFYSRAERLYEAWEKGDNGLADLNSLMVVIGQSENPYSKSSSFNTWLYGNELVDTLMLLTKSHIYVLAGKRKAEFFNPVVSESFHGKVPPVKAFQRDKGDNDKANFDRFVGYITDTGTDIGTFTKEVAKFDSDFIKAWSKILDENSVKKVDVSPAFSHLFAVKDNREIDIVKKSATATVNTWTAAKKKYVEIIDAERKVKHTTLAKDFEGYMKDSKYQSNLAKHNIESCYEPFVMSGGTYSFKWNYDNTENHLSYGFGAIITSLGCRLEDYCSNVTRTMLISPSKDLEAAYEAILATEMAVIEALKPGALIKDVYNVGVRTLESKNPKLAENLYKKELGFVTGIEFREGRLAISAKCEEKVRAGMVFVVYIGVDNIENKSTSGEKGKPAAISISDTVLVRKDEVNEILTDKAKSRLKSNVIRFREDAPEKEAEKENERNQMLGRGQRSVVITDQTRNKTTNEEKRRERQKELAKQLNEEAKARLAQQSGGSDEKKTKKSNVSYKTYDKFPQDSDIDALMIYVDRRHDTILLPIFGVPVPFHISMIKNCSQSVEGDFTYLRINFNHPGSQIGKESAQFPHPLATYLKELTYRASNVKEHGESNAPSFNLSTAFRLIKEIQKRFRTEEAEEREKEGAVKQDKLVLSQSKVNPKLKDLLIRPNIIQKRITGSLEAHVNGFRYTSLRGDRIDVVYNNIKHAFFQPCDNEMIILLHFHLKNPVMWGKKKYKDVQFYTEVGEITTDLGKFHHMQDRDDVQSEQMEREMRRKLNSAFSSFCDKVRRLTNDQVDFDSPFPDLGFFGVPYRSSCTLRPTSLNLVNLTEWPPFIVTLTEVELVHFERVSFQLKNFDMVFIFKDYARKPQMVQQIPMNSLDTIKEWLHSCDIRYTEGIQSLNWAKIMKTIVDDPEDFFENGGWSFLDTESDGEEGVADESEDSEEYDPSESEDEDEESDEDESEGDVTSDAESDEGSLGSDESEGKDWSDLEEEAAQADRRKEQEDGHGPSHGHRDKHRDKHREKHRERERERDRKRGPGGKGGPPMKKRK